MTWTPLELAANIMTVICIFLAGRNSIHTWWTGIVGCTLFGILFFQSKLYADVTLQLFFVVTGILGWRAWIQGKLNVVLPIARVGAYRLVQFAVGAAAVAAIYGAVLHFFTDAYAPFVDSMVLTFSVLAQFLLMRKYLETWLMWVVVNIFSVPLYMSRELYLTAGLYSVFLIHAIYAHFKWKSELEKQK